MDREKKKKIGDNFFTRNVDDFRDERKDLCPPPHLPSLYPSKRIALYRNEDLISIPSPISPPGLTDLKYRVSTATLCHEGGENREGTRKIRVK